MDSITRVLRTKVETKLQKKVKELINNNPALLINDDDANVDRIISKAMYRLLDSEVLRTSIVDYNEEIIRDKDTEHVRKLTHEDKAAMSLIMKAETNNEIAQLAWNELHEMYTGSTRLRSMYDNGVFKTIKAHVPGCQLWNGEIVSKGQPIPVKTLQAILLNAIENHKLHW